LHLHLITNDGDGDENGWLASDGYDDLPLALQSRFRNDLGSAGVGFVLHVLIDIDGQPGHGASDVPTDVQFILHSRPVRRAGKPVVDAGPGFPIAHALRAVGTDFIDEPSCADFLHQCDDGAEFVHGAQFFDPAGLIHLNHSSIHIPLPADVGFPHGIDADFYRTDFAVFDGSNPFNDPHVSGNISDDLDGTRSDLRSTLVDAVFEFAHDPNRHLGSRFHRRFYSPRFFVQRPQCCNANGLLARISAHSNTNHGDDLGARYDSHDVQFCLSGGLPQHFSPGEQPQFGACGCRFTGFVVCELERGADRECTCCTSEPSGGTDDFGSDHTDATRDAGHPRE